MPNKKPSVPKKFQAKEMLNKLDEFFAGAPKTEVQVIWDILSALRGPDSMDIHNKAKSTSVIRRAAFPKTAAIADEKGWYGIGGGAISKKGTLLDYDLYEERRHFKSHIRSAVEALTQIGIVVPLKPMRSDVKQD